MKNPTLGEYTETMANPAGRFRTLKKFRVVPGPDGAPRSFIHADYVDFLLLIGKQHWTLRCFFRRDRHSFFSLRETANYLSALENSQAVGMRFLPEEILVFNDAGESGYFDALLIHRPEGMNLGEYLNKICSSRDASALRKLADSFTEFACAHLISDRFRHGSIRPDNIRVCTDGSLLFTGLSRAVVPSMEQWSASPHPDEFPLSVIGLFIFCCRGEPAVGTLCETERLSSLRELKEWLLEGLAETEPAVRELARRLTRERSALDSLSTVEALRALHRLPASMPQSRFTPFGGKKGCDRPAFEWIGPFHEGLACASLNGKYGYVDRENRTVVPFLFDWGGSFDEGIAVVRREGLYGAVNKTGEYVLSPDYEDLVWHSSNGVLIACDAEGRWSLYGRDGKKTGPEFFDHICDFSAALACVARQGKYGFIDRQGKIAIPLIYDEADSFTPGRIARVRKNTEVFAIDTEGNRIS